MTDMPETIYAGIPANGKTRCGSYSHSPIPVNQHGKPSSRKCNPRVEYIRADKYEELKKLCDKLAEALKYVSRHNDGLHMEAIGKTRQALNEYNTVKERRSDK